MLKDIKPFKFFNLILLMWSAGDLHKRLVNYFNYKLIAGYKNKSIIYSSILKNGYECFNLEILEYSDKKKKSPRSSIGRAEL